MKFLAGILFELFAIVGVGYLLSRSTDFYLESSIESGDLPAVIDAMELRTQKFYEVYCYGLAAAGMAAALAIWYFTRGKAAVENQPLTRFFKFLLVPVGAFALISLLKPVPDLVQAVATLFEGNISLITILIFLVFGTILHYLCLSPFAALGTRSPNSKA